jgi:hypothetical protein
MERLDEHDDQNDRTGLGGASRCADHDMPRTVGVVDPQAFPAHGFDMRDRSVEQPRLVTGFSERSADGAAQRAGTQNRNLQWFLLDLESTIRVAVHIGNAMATMTSLHWTITPCLCPSSPI